MTQNVRFSTYAVPMIIGEIRRYLRDNNAIRVSRSPARHRLQGAQGAGHAWPSAWAASPTSTEIAEELELPRGGRGLCAGGDSGPGQSLYEPVYNDGGDALYVMDQVTDNKRPDNNWLDVIGLREAISRLSEREKHDPDAALLSGDAPRWRSPGRSASPRLR